MANEIPAAHMMTGGRDKQTDGYVDLGLALSAGIVPFVQSLGDNDHPQD